MEKTPHEILKAARELIATPDKWFRGHAGGGMGDRKCGQLCSLLAIVEIADAIGDIGAERALEDAMSAPIVEFNATHTHAEVLAAFDRAIEATAPKQTNISIFTEMLKTPRLEYKPALDTCGNG